MRIRIRSGEGQHMTIPVPLFLAGSPFVLKLAARYGGEEVAKYIPVARDLVRELRRFVRRNGHFTLVDVAGQDETYVKITV